MKIAAFALILAAALPGLNAAVYEVDANGGTYRSINEALKSAGPGDTVRVKPGIYREEVLLVRGGTREQPLILVSTEKHGAVVSGADVIEHFEDRGNGIFAIPLAGKLFRNPVPSDKNDGKRIPGQQIFIDGRPLDWVDEANRLFPGTWTAAGKELLFMPPPGCDLRQSRVELSTRKSTLSARGGVDYVVIDGFRFTQAADFKELPRSFQISGEGWVVKNVLSDWNSLNGAFLHSPMRCRIENSVFRWNGQLGLAANAAAECHLENNEFAFNNRRLCNTSDVAGGVKFIYSIDNTLKNNRFRCNYGQGIWFDISCSGNLIDGNVLEDTIQRGIFTETDWSQSIINNTVIRTWNNRWGQGAAICVAESSYCRIAGNLIAEGEGDGIRIRGDGFSREAAASSHARIAGDLKNNPNFMRNLPPFRRMRMLAEQCAFVNNETHYRSSSNTFTGNVIANCRTLFAEEIELPLPASQKGRCENYSDENIFIGANSNTPFRLRNNALPTLEEWQKHGRDRKSLSFETPEKAQLDKTIPPRRRTMAEVRALTGRLPDSPSAALLLQRVMLAGNAVPCPMKNPLEVTALKLKLAGRNCLALWSPAPDFGTTVRFQAAGRELVFENEYGDLAPMKSADGTVTLFVPSRPVYLWDVAEEIKEAPSPLTLNEKAIVFAPGAGETFTGVLRLPDGKATKVTLKSGEQYPIPAITGTVQLRGSLDGKEFYLARSFSRPAETARPLPAAPGNLTVDAAMTAWPLLAELGSLSGENGFALQVRGMRKERELILAVEVADRELNTESNPAKLFAGDSVELFLDGRQRDFQVIGEYSRGCYQLILAPGEQPGEVRMSNRQNLKDVKAFSAGTAGGYRLLISIGLTAENFPGAAEGILRLAIQANDRDNAGTLRQLRWGGTPENWKSTFGWHPFEINSAATGTRWRIDLIGSSINLAFLDGSGGVKGENPNWMDPAKCRTRLVVGGPLTNAPGEFEFRFKPESSGKITLCLMGKGGPGEYWTRYDNLEITGAGEYKALSAGWSKQGKPQTAPAATAHDHRLTQGLEVEKDRIVTVKFRASAAGTVDK